MNDNIKKDKLNTIFTEWVNNHTDTLYSWALHKTSDAQLAEDLVQDTFMAAFRSYENFRGDSKAKTWLLSILNNKIIDQYRKGGRNPVMNESSTKVDFSSVIESHFDKQGMWKKSHEPRVWPEEEHVLDNKEFQMILDHCMAQLPEKWNHAVQLKYLEEKKGKTISKELGITSTNYWQIIHRAKLSLRECLENLWFKE